MTRTDDLDIALNGYDPDDSTSARNRRMRSARRAPASFTADLPLITPAPKPKPQPTPQPPAQPADEREERRQPAAAEPQAKTKTKAEKRKAAAIEEAEPVEKFSFSSLFSIFTDERTRVFLGLTFLVACLFAIIAVVSHFKASEFDQSIVLNTTLSDMAANPGSVRNAGGGFGAWLSHIMLCDALGIGSIMFIAYFWLIGISLLGFRKLNFWALTFKSLLLAVTASVVLGLLTYHSPSVIKWGGSHGHYVNAWIISYATELGAILVSALLVLAVVCVYLNDIHTIWKKWKENSYRRKLQEELHRQRHKKAEHLHDVTEPAAAAETETEQNAQPAAPVSVSVEDTPIIDEETEPANTESATQDAEELANDAEMSEFDKMLAYDAPDETWADNKPFTIFEEKKETEENSDPTEPSTENAAPTEVLPSDAAEEVEKIAVAAEEAEKSNAPAEETEKATVPTEVKEEAAQDAEGQGTFSVVAYDIEAGTKPNQIDREPEQREPYDHRAELSRYRFPDVSLLKEHGTRKEVDMAEQQANKDRIIKTLLDYKIPISSIEATVGPTVTLYEIVPAEGVRIMQIKRLEDDIALSLSALGIRIIAPIPGRGTIGIEVPNAVPQTVSMKSIITSKKFQECKMALPMAMGATISNDIFIADLAKMPHMLVAGATGMGKSVGLNAIIASLLYKKHPSELKFVLVDPKMVEFSLYSKLERHYMAKLPEEEEAIITDPNKVIQTLSSLCVEMDNRFNLLKEAGVREISEYNRKFTERKLNPEKGHFYMPYIVIIVDEFADLIMMAGKEVETPIARIAQKGRAAGMHMIIATQRPSTNVITGLIKANFPGRIAFRVAQMVDSKTILDRTGANQLIGRGDMLFSVNGSMERVQCAFISTEEVEEITEWINNQVGYEQAYPLPDSLPADGEGGPVAGASSERDALFDEAARFVVSRSNASTSSLQRQFNIGYNRAGRLMDQMEAAGIVGPVNGAKPRNILVDSMSLEYILSQR